MQSKIEVGYVPYAKDLQHPGDRRRLAAWALDHETKLNLANPLDSDVLVLSNAANFGYWLKRAKQPVILDLVDGYLGEHPSFIKDVARNIVRTIRGTSNLRWITYTNHVRSACMKSDAVIVASKEQRDIILKFNKNVYVILDDHSELDSASSTDGNHQTDSTQAPISPTLFWEGFGYTLKHFRMIANELDRFLLESGWGMYLVTNEQFPRWGGYIGTVKTRDLVEKWFPLSKQAIQVIPWSIENLIKFANLSTLGLIPIDTRDKFAALKPENKLLSMWHLGLPVLFSDTPSYSRLASESHQEHACIKDDGWLAALTTFSQSFEARKELKRLGMAYISEQHTHEILITKWSETLASVLASRETTEMSALRLHEKKSLSPEVRMHMVYGLDFGGCETQMVNLATEYAIRDLQGKILFCSLTKGGIAEKKIRDLGFEVFCLDLMMWEKPFTSLFKLIRFLRHYSILMLITSGSEANLFGGIAGRFAHARLIVTEEIGVRTNSTKQRFFIRFAYKIANFNFAVSKLARENLLRQRLVDPKKCIVSYAPLNLIRGAYKTVPYKGDVALLYLGRIHPEKDFELLLSSLSQVLSGGQRNFNLVIVGARNIEEYDFLRTTVANLKLENNVEIHYATSQPNEFIDKCHFLVQSSRSEGMGYSVLEAISRNKPIISTNVGIVPEIIVDGIHGFVSKSHELNSFVEVLSQALSIDEAKYKEMTESVSRIDLSFVETSRYLDLLDSLTGKSGK